MGCERIGIKLDRYFVSQVAMMRVVALTACAFAALMAWQPAQADILGRNGSALLPEMSGGEATPQVAAGDRIGVACAALSKAAANTDVRVVLTLAHKPGETPLGYKKVLATDEKIGRGTVRIRVPAVPDLENHTVNVDIYVVGGNHVHSCDAGSMTIVRRRAVPWRTEG